MTEHSMPSDVLSGRVRQLRAKRGWTADDLAERMRHEGWSWGRSTVAKIEAVDRLNRRAVDVDELVSLAFVLGVSPIALLVPTASGSTNLTPNTMTQTGSAWHWMTGLLPMGGPLDGDESGPEAQRRFYSESAPNFVVTAETRVPGLRALQQQAASVIQALGVADEYVARVFPNVLAEVEELHAASGRLLDGFRAYVGRVKREKGTK